VVKQRIAWRGQGRSKGYRTIILFQRGASHYISIADRSRFPDRAGFHHIDYVPAGRSLVATGNQTVAFERARGPLCRGCLASSADAHAFFDARADVQEESCICEDSDEGQGHEYV
jgi:hypothetical protein